MKTLVMIPAYNEAKNILKVIHELNKNCPDVDYLIMNDCSSDETAEICQKNNLNVVNLPINLGIGGGVQTGYIYALQNDYDIAIQIDGDGQHDSKYIHDLIKPLVEGNADITIGSRFIKKEGFQSSHIRRIGISFLSSLIWRLFHVRVYDVTSGFRAVNKRFIKIYANDYAQDYPEPEAIVVAALKKAKILEVPVIMREREHGQSSIGMIKSVYYMIRVSISIIIHKIAN